MGAGAGKSHHLLPYPQTLPPYGRLSSRNGETSRAVACIIYFTQDSGFPKLNRAKPGAAKPKSKPTAASARPEANRPWIF